jgi:hypothetical protein
MEEMQNNDVANMPNIGSHLRNIVKNTTPEVEPEPTPEVTTPQVENTTEQPVAEQPIVEAQPEKESEPDLSWLDGGVSEQVVEKNEGPSTDEKLRFYEALMQDKEAQLFIEAKKAGKSLLDLTKEYQVIDYDSMSAEDLAKHYGRHLGLSDDQIEESIDSISSMNPIQKFEMTNSWKDKLNGIQASKIDQIAGGYKKTYETQSWILEKAVNDLEREAASIIDKELFSTKFTNKDADDFKSFVRNFNTYNSDGSMNMALLKQFWIGTKISSIQKANFAKGASEGRKEILKEIHRPSDSSSIATKLPEVKSNQSDNDKAQKALKAIMSGKF